MIAANWWVTTNALLIIKTPKNGYGYRTTLEGNQGIHGSINLFISRNMTEESLLLLFGLEF